MYEYLVYVQVLSLLLWFHNFFHKKHLRKSLSEKYLDLKLCSCGLQTRADGSPVSGPL